MQIATQRHHRAAFDGTDGWKMPCRTHGCQMFFLKSVCRISSGCNMSSLPSFHPWGSKSKASIPEAGRHTCEPPGPSCQQMVRSQAPRCLGHVQLRTCKLENWILFYAIFSLGVQGAWLKCAVFNIAELMKANKRDLNSKCVLSWHDNINTGWHLNLISIQMS